MSDFYSTSYAKRKPSDIFSAAENIIKKISNSDKTNILDNIKKEEFKKIATLIISGIKKNISESEKKDIIDILNNQIKFIVQNEISYFNENKLDIEEILKIKMISKKVEDNPQVKITIFRIIIQKLKAELSDSENYKTNQDGKQIANEEKDKQMAI